MSLRRRLAALLTLRRLGAFATAPALALAGWAAVPGSLPQYLLSSAYFQGELLYKRVPIEDAIRSGRYDEKKVAKLRLVSEMKGFGREIGLSSTENYDTISADWDRTIWNVSACDELSFRPHTWRFPIVGTFPYLGFFREGDARSLATTLQRQGYDVHVRTAGAYSTLGWFRDPLLPKMLDWTEHNLAGTLFHELAHATLWIPGSVQFNESFANFVGEEAAMRWLAHAHGPESAQVADVIAGKQDRERFRELMHGVYGELEAVYADPSTSRDEKRMRKHVLLAELPVRTARLGLPAGYVRSVQQGEWNNARLLQFKTYNRNSERFAALLAQEEGDLPRFMERLQAITAGADDPYEALSSAVGAPPVADASEDPDR